MPLGLRATVRSSTAMSTCCVDRIARYGWILLHLNKIYTYILDLADGSPSEEELTGWFTQHALLQWKNDSFSDHRPRI